MRAELLSYLPWFVRVVTEIPGVRRISLLGSITTDKQDPKDIDFLVVVDDDAGLERLARYGRKLKGRTQQISRGADIFLADVEGRYIGRTCQWKECRTGERARCDALNCGIREYLHDDLGAIKLTQETMQAALQLWPEMERRLGLPEDLERVLEELEAGIDLAS